MLNTSISYYALSTLILYLNYFILEYVPNTSFHSFVSHVGKKFHILTDLIFVFITRFTELEVDYYCFVTVSNYPVRPAFHVFTIFINLQDTAFAENLPVRLKPICRPFI